MFKHYYFICKSLLLFVFFCSCTNNTVSLSSATPGWCFYNFENRSTFDNYIVVHESSVKNSNNVNSMQLLGCAYYQKGDLLMAEKWLTNAYSAGDKGSSTALTAIYLKEGNLRRAATWGREIQVETDHVRWLRVVEEIKNYQKFDNVTYLKRAYDALNYKINYEGQTGMTVQLLNVINDLLEQEQVCRDLTSPDCSVFDFNERKNYIYILSEGVLAVMIPSVPLAWRYDPGDVASVEAIQKTAVAVQQSEEKEETNQAPPQDKSTQDKESA